MGRLSDFAESTAFLIDAAFPPFCSICGIDAYSYALQWHSFIEICHDIDRDHEKWDKKENGSKNDISNLFIGCGVCNKRQGKRSLRTWLAGDMDWINRRRVKLGNSPTTADAILRDVEDCRNQYRLNAEAERPRMREWIKENSFPGSEHWMRRIAFYEKSFAEMDNPIRFSPDLVAAIWRRSQEKKKKGKNG
jgi:hypothetical protein